MLDVRTVLFSCVSIETLTLKEAVVAHMAYGINILYFRLTAKNQTLRGNDGVHHLFLPLKSHTFFILYKDLYLVFHHACALLRAAYSNLELCKYNMCLNQTHTEKDEEREGGRLRERGERQKE